MNYRRLEQGKAVGTIIAIVALIILVVLFGSFSVWAYTNYIDQKDNVDTKVSDAVAKAVLESTTKSEKAFAEREKEPKRQFVGPEDYGRLTFDYPKTWSAYQHTDISKGGGVTYEAYLNPQLVPPIINPAQKVALRVMIEQKTYEKSLEQYAKQIKKGELKSNPYNEGAVSGTMISGSFTKDMVSTAVIIKMRDRTLTMRTDGDVFKDDFAAILKTVKFNE